MPESSLRMQDMEPSTRTVCRLIRMACGYDAGGRDPGLTKHTAMSVLSTFRPDARSEAYRWFMDSWTWEGDDESLVCMSLMEQHDWHR